MKLISFLIVLNFLFLTKVIFFKKKKVISSFVRKKKPLNNKSIHLGFFSYIINHVYKSAHDNDNLIVMIVPLLYKTQNVF